MLCLNLSHRIHFCDWIKYFYYSYTVYAPYSGYNTIPFIHLASLVSEVVNVIAHVVVHSVRNAIVMIAHFQSGSLLYYIIGQ